MSLVRAPSTDLVRSSARKLDSRDADILVVPRQLELDIEQAVRDAPLGEQRLKLSLAQAPTVIRDRLRDMRIDSPCLAEDIAWAARLFADLLDQSQVELKMEITNRQSCPKFHCDNVFLRLLITYSGPATEYIHVEQPGDIRRASNNALVFLKGHKHATYQDQVLHRSPPMAPGQRRFCVTVNVAEWLGS